MHYCAWDSGGLIPVFVVNSCGRVLIIALLDILLVLNIFGLDILVLVIDILEL